MRLYANLTRLLSKAFRTGPQVAVVGTQIVKFDGTSNAIRDTIRAVTGAGWRVSIFTRINQFEDIPAQLVTSAHDISQRAAFQSADVIIYHFAFYDELFEIMQNGNGKAFQIVLFHNVTPEEYIAEELRPFVARSFAQIQHFHHADRLLAVYANKRGGLDPGGDGRFSDRDCQSRGPVAATLLAHSKKTTGRNPVRRADHKKQGGARSSGCSPTCPLDMSDSFPA